jgi:leucyl-tRNA synthetase
MLTIVIQVNGKLRGRIEIAADADREEVEQAALAEANIARQLEKLTVRRILHVPGKLVNIVAD